jgi:hypothetical protein
MADTSDAQIGFALDATPTAVLVTPAWQLINFVSHDFAPANDVVSSKVIRPDASNKDTRRIGGGFTGTLAMELARDTELETLMSYALRGAWVTNVLKAGVAKNSIAFEEKIFEGATPFYQRYRGTFLGGFALEVTTDGIADIRFPVQGRIMEDDTAIVVGATYPAAGTAPVLLGVEFTALTLSGWTGPMDVEQLSIDMTNNLRADRKLGSKDPRAIPYGKRMAIIDLTAYFRDNEAFQKFKADGTTAASFGFVQSGGTAGFTFQFDRARVTAYGKPVPGENQTIKVTLQLTATYDTTNSTDFRITRIT